MLHKEEAYGRNQNYAGRTGKVSIFAERRKRKIQRHFDINN